MADNQALELVHSVVENKRASYREEKKRRLVNRGVSEERAEEMVARQEYNNLSSDKKLDRLEALFVQTFQGLQRDILALRHNDGVIADAMDINLKAMSKCLEKAGISKDIQGDIIKEVEAELREEQRKHMEAQESSKRQAEEMSERQRMESLSQEENKISQKEDCQGEIPPEASIFGG